RANRAEAAIDVFDDVLFVDRLPETRPARAGFEFRVRAEERGLAADAAIQAFLVVVPGRAGEGEFRVLPSCDVERDLRELFLPLPGALDDLGQLLHAAAGASVGELDD